MKTNQIILNEYIELVDYIDDYLEYRYKNDSKQEIRDTILLRIDKMINSLKEKLK